MSLLISTVISAKCELSIWMGIIRKLKYSNIGSGLLDSFNLSGELIGVSNCSRALPVNLCPTITYTISVSILTLLHGLLLKVASLQYSLLSSQQYAFKIWGLSFFP